MNTLRLPVLTGPRMGPRYHKFDKDTPADFALFVRSMLRLNDSKQWRVDTLEYGPEEAMTPKKRGVKPKKKRYNPQHPDGVWMYRITYISKKPVGPIYRHVEGTWK